MREGNGKRVYITEYPMAAERIIHLRWLWNFLLRAALMEMARAVKDPIDMSGEMVLTKEPNSVALLIVVPPVTAVITVQTANT